MTMASFQSMRMASQAKDNEEKKVQERKKALLVLICRHLCDYGYIESAERLQTEGGISLQNVDAADNIDLLNVLQEYEDFYEIRFQRRPKLTRKLGIDARTAAEQAKLPNVSKIGASSARRRPSLTSSTKASDDDSASDAAPNGKPSSAPGVGRPPKGAGAGGAVATKKAPAEDPRMGLNITSTKAVVGEGSLAQAEAKFRKGGGGGCRHGGGQRRGSQRVLGTPVTETVARLWRQFGNAGAGRTDPTRCAVGQSRCPMVRCRLQW